jgi:hypothetical protein
MGAGAAALVADAGRRMPADLYVVAPPLELSARTEVRVASSSWTCSRLSAGLAALVVTGVCDLVAELITIRNRHGNTVSTA